MATNNLGRVAMIWRGAYVPTTPYVVLDLVSLNGTTYLCTAPALNKNPETETGYWAIASTKGDTAYQQAVAGGYAGTLNDFESSLASVDSKMDLVDQFAVVATAAALKADAMASGSPKARYATLVALRAALPAGDTGAYLVEANFHLYFWDSVTSAWVDGGEYNVAHASKVAITDTGLNFISTEVEGALGEVGSRLNDIKSRPDVKKAISFYVGPSIVYATVTAQLDAGLGSGANQVAFIVNYTQTLKTDNIIIDLSAGTKSGLASLVTYIVGLGLPVHVRASCVGLDGSGLSITPTDESAWVTNWQERMLALCALVYPLGARYLTVSNENRYCMDGNATEWAALVAAVHSAYPLMQVSADVNAFTYAECTVYDVFDIIGYNLYPCVSDIGLAETDENMRKAFFNDLYGYNHIKTLTDLYNTYGKPVWITEVGCVSYTGALSNPGFDKTLLTDPVYSEATQKKFYNLVFELVYKRMSTIAALTLFRIGDDDWTFVGKTAEATVAEYWEVV